MYCSLFFLLAKKNQQEKRKNIKHQKIPLLPPRLPTPQKNTKTHKHTKNFKKIKNESNEKIKKIREEKKASKG